MENFKKTYSYTNARNAKKTIRFHLLLLIVSDSAYQTKEKKIRKLILTY